MNPAVGRAARWGGLSLAGLARDAGLYGLAEAVTKGAWLLGVPIFARLLAPAEFGVVELVMALGWIVLPLVILGQDFSVQGFFYEARPGSPGVVTAALVVGAGSMLVWLLASQLAAPLVARTLAAGLPAGPAIRLGLAWVCVNAYLRLLRYPLRLDFQVGAYFQVSLLNTAGGLALALLLVGLGLSGVEGYFLGLLLGGMAAAGLAAWKLRRHWSRPVRAGEVRATLALGLPFVPIALLEALTLYVDRFFLTRWTDLETIGVYALAQKSVLLLEFPLVMLSLAWAPRALAAYHQHPDAYGGYHRRVLNLGLLGFLGLAVGVTCLAPEVIRVLGPAAYGAASQAVGPLTVLVIGMALGRICSVTVVAQRRPAIALALTALAGASHAGAAFLLIPRFGPWGAAVASAAAQWVLGVGYYVVAARADAGVRLDRRVLVLVAGGAAALAYLGPALTAGPLLLRAGVALAGAGLASALALSLTRAAGVLSAGSRLDVLEGAPR